MAETKNIDEMAAIISERIFREMKWNINMDYTDLNWDCVEPRHKKKTHPTDIVLDYKDPYTGTPIFFQTDLKSYAKATISTGKINNALKSLAMQVECAVNSQGWIDYYSKGLTDYQVKGLLFIYNNCGEYHKELLDAISGITKRPLHLPKDSTVNVFSPKLIRFLMTVVENIKYRRSIEADSADEFKWQHIPERKKCGFYYPDKHTQSAEPEVKHPASIEMITSGLILYSYTHQYFERRVLNVYWDEMIDSDSYFIYLFEFLFNYQLLNIFKKVYIITPFSADAGSYFKTAKEQYKEHYAVSQFQKARIDQIEYIYLDTVSTSIFPYQVASGEVVRHLVKGE